MDNPFSLLDKKSFPSAKDKKAYKVKEKTKELNETEVSQEFLAAVETAKPLKKNGKNLKKTTDNVDLKKTTDNVGLTNPVLVPMETPAPKKKKKILPPIVQPEPLAQPVEEEIFFSAMQAVQPLPGKGRAVIPEVEISPPSDQSEDTSLQDFIDGKLEFSLAFTDEYVEGHVLGLDLLTVGKLQAGQLSPEAHLDLHGLNAMQAYTALLNFLRSAYHKGQRTVLIVCGRGHNSIHNTPVLREKLQSWFTQEPLKRIILAFCTAKSRDGGAGALYVLIRKFRKDRGKVHWERMPVDQDLL